MNPITTAQEKVVAMQPRVKAMEARPAKVEATGFESPSPSLANGVRIALANACVGPSIWKAVAQMQSPESRAPVDFTCVANPAA